MIDPFAVGPSTGAPDQGQAPNMTAPAPAPAPMPQVAAPPAAVPMPQVAPGLSAGAPAGPVILKGKKGGGNHKGLAEQFRQAAQAYMAGQRSVAPPAPAAPVAQPVQ